MNMHGRHLRMGGGGGVGGTIFLGLNPASTTIFCLCEYCRLWHKSWVLLLYLPLMCVINYLMPRSHATLSFVFSICHIRSTAQMHSTVIIAIIKGFSRCRDFQCRIIGRWTLKVAWRLYHHRISISSWLLHKKYNTYHILDHSIEL